MMNWKDTVKLIWTYHSDQFIVRVRNMGIELMPRFLAGKWVYTKQNRKHMADVYLGKINSTVKFKVLVRSSSGNVHRNRIYWWNSRKIFRLVISIYSLASAILTLPPAASQVAFWVTRKLHGWIGHSSWLKHSRFYIIWSQAFFKFSTSVSHTLGSNQIGLTSITVSIHLKTEI